MKSQQPQMENAQFASAKAVDLHISTKHSVEISRNLRYHSTTYAKRFLQEVAVLRRAVSFKRFTKDRGHKAGMAAGQFPQKAAKEFLKLVRAAEANAQSKGLDGGNLKIVKILANKASIPFTGSRFRRRTKRTHLEVVVQDMSGKKQKKEIPSTKHQIPNEGITEEKHNEGTKKEKVENADKDVHSSTSEQLLQQAQAHAAELKKKEHEKGEAEHVAHLVEELQKKGTLRSQQQKPRGAR